MIVNGTTFNNSGQYDITLTSGNVFSGGGSNFNNTGTLLGHADVGTVSFNMPLTNTGTVSAETGTLSLVSGGTSSGLFSASSGAVLELGSNFSFTDGAEFAGAGTIVIDNNTSTSVAGAINNSGNILLNSSVNIADLVLGADVTLTGGGTLSLVNFDRVYGSGILTNVDNTIQGFTNSAGYSLGLDQIGIVNQAAGVIDANVAGLTLFVNPNAANGLVNNGLLRASNGGILYLDGSGGGGFTNNGTITALDGSQVQLANGAVITGGMFTTEGTGVIENINTATLISLTNAGNFIGNNNSFTTLVGTITNTGSISLNSTGNVADLILSGDVALTGGGTLNLVNFDRVYGSGVLTNVDNTIQGQTNGTSYSLGLDQIGIINQAAGVIDANVLDLTLFVNPNLNDGLVNHGLLRASNGGILYLDGSGGGGFTNTGATITALDGSEVQLANGAVITGGTLTTVGSGVIRDVSTATLNSLTNAGTFIGNNNTFTTLIGTITNTGSISLNSEGNVADLILNGNVTLTGGGTLNLVNFDRVYGSGVLTNVDNTIQGFTNGASYSLGLDQIGIINQAAGVIDANVSGKTLFVNPDAADGLINHGLLRASNGGILYLDGSGGGGFTNTGATITALDGSEVQLATGAVITGGTLTTVGSGVIRNVSTATLNSLTNAGTFIGNNNTFTTLIGTITNTGSISLNSGGNVADLILSGNVTLTGGGSLNLVNFDRVYGSGVLTNDDNTIQGFTNSASYSLGLDQIGIVNQAAGVIDANVLGLTLFVNPRAADGLINHGLLRASNGGILYLDGSGGGGFTNTGATVTALDGSEVQLATGAVITGGTLSTVGTGVIRNVSTATLNSLTNAGTFIANNNTFTTLIGTITNTASISLNSGGNVADLILSGNVTLTGGGTLNLVNFDRVYGSGVLTNVNNTIQGFTNSTSYSLGLDQIGIVNQAAGVIDANVLGLTLFVDPNATNGLVNQGVMRASNGGTLFLSGNGGGAFTNSGTIEATGGTLQVSGTVTSSGTVDVGADSLSITGSGSYTQTAGTFRLAGGSVTSTTALVFNGGLIDARGSMTAALTNSANLQPALGGTGLSVTGAVSLLSASKLTFQLGGLTQGSEYGFLNVNGTVALGGQLVLTFVNGFQNSVTNNDNFTVLSSSSALSGTFSNIASGTRLTTSDGFGTFVVTYTGNNVVLSNFLGNAFGPLNFAGPSSTTGNGGNGGAYSLTTTAVTFGLGSGEIPAAYFSGGNAAPNSSYLGGDGGTLAVTATSGDIVVGADLEASSGSNGADVISGKGGSVTLAANTGAVTVNNRIQVSHNAAHRRSSTGGNITLKSGKTSGVAINVANTGQLLSLLDAAAPGPSGKVVIQATAPSGNSQVNISGKVQADRGTVDIRSSGSSGQVNLTNADIRADTFKAAALGSNGVLRIGGGSLTADTTLQLYAPNGNGQVVFIGNVSLNGNSTKSIAGDSVTINNGVLVTVNGPKASVYVNSQNNVPKANYSGFGGNGKTSGTFGGSGANAPQPLGNAPALGLPPGS